MCVAASQKLTQSSTDPPPPPATLGTFWLGLVDPDDGGSRTSVLVVVPVVVEAVPPPSGVVVRGADSGAAGVTLFAGAPIADGGRVKTRTVVGAD